jgi:hypothetical protein
MDSDIRELSISDKESIFDFIESHYDLYHYKEDPETVIPPLINEIEIALNSKQLLLSEKGSMLFFKSALTMMIDKGSSQLEKDLLKAVSINRSKRTH